MPKRPEPDLAEFQRCKGLITDIYEHMAETITSKKTVMMAANRLADMRWLAAEIHRLSPAAGVPVSADVLRVTKTLARVCDEQAASIKTNQFVSTSAGIFRTYRTLVRELEKVVRLLLDPEEVLSLAAAPLGDEHKPRGSLEDEDLMDVGEDEPEPEKKPKKKAEAALV